MRTVAFDYNRDITFLIEDDDIVTIIECNEKTDPGLLFREIKKWMSGYRVRDISSGT